MSKKKLLSESQVRRFMGLAGIKPLNEMSYMKKDDELEEGMREEELDEMRGSMKKDDEMREMRGDMKKDDEMREQEEPEMDMDDEAGDADVEMDEEDLADVKSALDTLQDKLAPLLDQAEDAEMDMDAEEPEMDMDAEEPAEEPEMDMEKELQEVDMELTEEEIVNEVARRVAKRIVEAKRAHKKMNEALGRKK
tara:strand:- start:136 stop:717 length:582 start_codon:yes stop_codon:yes gene_type:complete